MNRNGFGLAILALLVLAVAPAAAQTRGPWLQIGMLNCRLNPSIGFIIGGHQSMECRFTPNQPEPPQAYDGAINAVGVDVGFSSGGVLAWAVFARTLGAPVGALAGEYVGVSSDVDIGIGGGANILIGGSGRTFALQPVSFEGSIGLNVSLGVSALKLRPAR